MAAAAARSSSSRRAAATETRVTSRTTAFDMKEIGQFSAPSSVRVHGTLAICRESVKIGDMRSGWEREEGPPDVDLFDHRTEVQDPSLFRSHGACRDLIHRMLAESPVTAGKCDLAADNWVNFQPHDIATTIVARVRGDTENRPGVVVPPYALDIRMVLTVRLIYSEPKALLLACKEAAKLAETDVAGGRLPSSENCHGGELTEQCAICLLDEGMKNEETVRLPCSHAFHSRCILPWFIRVSTCPTCRCDAMEHFDFGRSALDSDSSIADISATHIVIYPIIP
jgi:hypothetical protein